MDISELTCELQSIAINLERIADSLEEALELSKKWLDVVEELEEHVIETPHKARAQNNGPGIKRIPLE